MYSVYVVCPQIAWASSLDVSEECHKCRTIAEHPWTNRVSESQIPKWLIIRGWLKNDSKICMPKFKLWSSLDLARHHKNSPRGVYHRELSPRLSIVIKHKEKKK